MFNKTFIMLWLRKKETRRIRLFAAAISVIVMAFIAVLIFTAILPRYILTLEGRLSFMTPSGFKINQLFSFQENKDISDAIGDRSLVLPLPDNREIRFQYPEVIQLGNPSHLSDEITQSLDFTISGPKAHGLIQIWNLSTPFKEFIDASESYSQTKYLKFKSTESEINGFKCIIWDYSFESSDKKIHGIEAFFDDKPYLYRVSLFSDEKSYNPSVRKIFDDIIRSVKVE